MAVIFCVPIVINVFGVWPIELMPSVRFVNQFIFYMIQESPSINPGEMQILNQIAAILLSGNRQAVLLFLYKNQAGVFNFTGIVPNGSELDADFIAKFKELASEYVESMANLPTDNFASRITKLLNKWRNKDKIVDAEISKDEQSGSVNIKFKI